MTKYHAIDVDGNEKGDVVTIKLVPPRIYLANRPPARVHDELTDVLNQLRATKSVRVVILTGAEDGEFSVPAPTAYYESDAYLARIANPISLARQFMGVIQVHQAIAEIDVPVIAKLNGDAVAFGQSLMFACDLIVARSDAKISDGHLALGGTLAPNGSGHVGLLHGLAPGDGAGSLVPLFMSPTLAKEYLMLSRERTAADLQAAGIINYAVKAEQLDATVAELVVELLRRPREALAWTKRLVNRRVAAQLNLTLDASVAYEMLTMNFIPTRPGAKGGDS